MTQKILVPTDFSANAMKAIYYAAEMAHRAGGEIHLLHVIEPALDLARMQEISSREREVQKSSSELITLHKTLESLFPDLKVVKHLSGGIPADATIDYAEQNDIGLIVMGTSGASGLKEFFIGSVASGVIAKMKIPVLTIPASYEPEEPDAILLATNRFEKNMTVLQKVISLANNFSANIHIVVFKQSGGDGTEDYIYNEEQVNDYLAFLKTTFPESSFRAALLEGTDFELTIDQYCNEQGADVIAMMNYPKSFWKKLMRNSMTRKMALHSTIPVLAIPASVNEQELMHQ